MGIELQFTEFIEGLGVGQLVGRQVLASPCHGEIQVGLRDHQGLLEVEIVRARNLLQKAFVSSKHMYFYSKFNQIDVAQTVNLASSCLLNGF